VGIPHAQPILEVAANIGLACFVVAALGSVAAVVVRFRRSRGEERQQLKWLVYATAVLLVVNVLPMPGRLVLDGTLELEVRDDGAGLSAGYQTGIGLASMRERAAELGGSCTIQPSLSGGTRVLARFPVPPP
jgi:hypothetical protein